MRKFEEVSDVPLLNLVIQFARRFYLCALNHAPRDVQREGKLAVRMVSTVGWTEFVTEVAGSRVQLQVAAKD